MDVNESKRLNAVLAVAAGFGALLSVFYYLQRLSYYLGEAYGVLASVKAYNITVSSSPLLNLISASGALSVGLYLVYTMLPFAIIMFAMGVSLFVSRQFTKRDSAVMGLSSVAFLFLTAVTEFSFNLGISVIDDYIAYAAAVLGIAAALYPYVYAPKKSESRRAYPIEINPDTPYTNFLILTNKLMKRLSGEIRVLDMHFDVRGAENLARLVNGSESRYSKIYVLSKGERLGREFDRAYYDLKDELKNKGVELELRLLSDDDAIAQHERLIMDDTLAYKIPPLNIINKKSEHIVGVNHSDAYARFSKLWDRSEKYENRVRDEGK